MDERQPLNLQDLLKILIQNLCQLEYAVDKVNIIFVWREHFVGQLARRTRDLANLDHFFRPVDAEVLPSRR